MMFCILSIVILIVVAIIIVKDEKKRKVKQKETTDLELKSRYYNMLSDIMNECWDKKNYTFNWNIWFDRRDDVVLTSHQFVLEKIDADFKCYGRLQVMRINTGLKDLFENGSNQVSEKTKTFLKDWINYDTVLNLESMFSYKNGQYDNELCPETVKLYRVNLLELFHRDIDWSLWTPEKINNIITLGEKILQEEK